jgi:hypothetical protein
MAGLAATFKAPGRIDRIAVALAPRGLDGAVCSLPTDSGVGLEVAVRSVIPVIGKVTDDSGEAVAAIAVDGIASLSALDAAYAARGPRGLLDSEEPCAVVVADRQQPALVLARTVGAPGLYYAAIEDGWVAASEPEALLRAGVPDEPDTDVVAEFVERGVSDQGERTCYAAIRRVPAGVAVVLGGRAGTVTHGRPAAGRTEPVATTLARAVSGGRVGVLVGPGVAGAAVLGTALARPDRPRPLPVYTVTFPGFDGPAANPPAVLVPLPHGTVRSAAFTFDPHTLDLDAFLADVGEPVGDLTTVLAWAVARRLDAGVDTLVSAASGDPAALARVSDRTAARYGVAIRAPLATPPDGRPVDPVDLMSVVDKTLPGPVARYAREDSAAVVRAAELVRALGAEVAAAVVTPRPWADHRRLVDDLRRLHSGEPIDAARLLRAYLVERWLDRRDARAAASSVAAPTSTGLDYVHSAGRQWARVSVRTDVVRPGDPALPLAAVALARALTDLVEQRGFADSLRRPWFAVIAGKVIAVSQQRVSPLWQLKPGRAARLLARAAGRRRPGRAEPWTIQVAIADHGLARVGWAVLGLYLPTWWPARLRPAPLELPYQPRSDAVAPAGAAVVSSPHNPPEVAEAFVEAVRLHAPAAVFGTLAGCAVASADGESVRLLGYAPGPAGATVADPEPLLRELLADNPGGQARELTPVLLICEAPPPVVGEERRARDFVALDADGRPARPRPASQTVA